ncbi:MAG: tetratricopeptide repeat protein [Kiritimatiellia bacterium]
MNMGKRATNANQTGLTAVKQRRTIRAASLVLVLLTCAAYWNSLRGVFVYDDINAIRDNLHIRRLWPLSEAIALPLWSRGIALAGRPVAALSFALNTVLLGPQPWAYHLVNLLIHLSSGLFLFGIVRRTLERVAWPQLSTRSTVVAAIAAALWLVHPLGTAAVTYIVQRCESLMAFFYLLTLYCAIRGFELSHLPRASTQCNRRVQRWFLAAVLACALGMGTKEVMFTAPILVYLYDAIFESPSFAAPLTRRAGFYALLAGTWTISIGLFFTTLREKTPELTLLSPRIYLLTQAGVVLHYLRLAFWPHPLVVNYNWPSTTSLRNAAVPVAIISVLLVLTAASTARRKWYGFLGCWFFLILAPTSSIVPIFEPIHEQRPYLSLAGLSTLIAVAGALLQSRLRKRGSHRLAAVLSFLAAGAILTLGYRTFRRNRDYYSAETLWRSNVTYRPTSYIAHNGLGVALLEQGRLAEAEECFRQAIRQADESHRSYATAHVNLGNVLMATRQLGKAEQEFTFALETVERLGPYHPAAAITFNSLASLCMRRRDWTGALHYYERSLAIQRDRPGTHSGVAVALAHLGDFERALQHAQQALELHRILGIRREAYEAYDALGRVLVQRRQPGDLEKAIEFFQRAVELEPRSDAAFNNLGNAFFLLGNLTEAVRCYRCAIDINRRNWEAWHNYGMALKRQADLRGAESCFREAVRLNPAYAEAWHSLGLLLLQEGKYEAALPYLERVVALAPEWDVAWNNLGLVLLHLAEQAPRESNAAAQNLERAAACFRKSLQINDHTGFCLQCPH